MLKVLAKTITAAKTVVIKSAKGTTAIVRGGLYGAGYGKGLAISIVRKIRRRK